MSEWWPIQSTGMIFGIAGGACGVLGGIFGTAVGVLVPRGRGKPFVYCCLALLCAIAISSIARSQPAIQKAALALEGWWSIGGRSGFRGGRACGVGRDIRALRPARQATIFATS